nr:capsid protein VP1 [Psittaciform chaphamaparvovirus 6]
MATDETITNTYMAYISNQPYNYPSDQSANVALNSAFNTGWNVIPNMLWRHVCTPKQWAELQIKYEAYHVEGLTVTLFNMVPMTTQLAIGGQSVFTSFNNTIYAVGYQDDLYETAWEPWLVDSNKNVMPNLAWKEGQIQVPGSNTKKRNELPVYLWQTPTRRVNSNTTWANSPLSGSGLGVFPEQEQLPSGLFWDPFNRPDHLQELRPGKNAINFRWNCHPSDESIWFNFDQLAAWYPYTATGPYPGGTRPDQWKLTNEMDPDRLATQHEHNPHLNDYTIPNLANQPLVPCAWWWKEMQQSLIEDWDKSKADLRFPGTEYEQAHYPPEQMFVKMIPLFDDNGTLVEITANVSIKVELKLKCKTRRSAIFCPTWGPIGWRNVYSAQCIEQCYSPAMVRYRTAGARRTWQNIASGARSHPREDPYSATEKVPGGTGYDNTSIIPRKSILSKPAQNLQMEVDTATMSRQTTISPPQPIKRKSPKTQPLDINTTIFKHITDTQL